MREIVSILIGAGFTVSVSVALGSLLLGWLRVDLRRLEAGLIAFVAGAGCLSFLVAILCAVHQARKGVFLWGGLAAIALAGWQSRGRPKRKDLPSIPLKWVGGFVLVYGAFGIYYLVNALAPEISPDGSGYHLGNVARIWRAHGFVWDYHSMYSYLSQGTEMLFLVAYSFGRHQAAALVHLTYLCTLPLLIICTGRRLGYWKAAIFAALVVFVSPVIGKDGISAYNDLAVVTLIYAVFHLLQVWDETRQDKLLVLIGLASGAAYGAKYTAFLTLPFALAWVAFRARTERQPLRQGSLRLVTVALPAVLLIAPWILRNWIWLGNPFAPFLNAWFPNPYIHAGMERSYAEMLRHYFGIKNNWEIPLQLTLRGGVVGGALGPVFLLAPFALFALRMRFGRKLLLAALVFALPAYLNVGSRFLIPCAPFVAFALGLVLSEIPAALPLLAVYQVLLCWPSVLSTYCDPWNWRLSSFPWRVALHQEPADPYILKSLGDYGLKHAIELSVPPGQRVFTFAGRPDAYIDRDIVVSYESTQGNLVNDIFWTQQGHLPNWRQSFKFQPISTRSIRIVNNTTADDYWTVAEMRLYSEGRELPRSAGWRLSAKPNGWEAQLAFDNSYATRWSTWQAMSPGDRIQVDFAGPETIDEVVLECDPAWKARLQVEVQIPSGRWVPLTDTGVWTKTGPPAGLRRAAAREIEALGFHYILVNEGDLLYEELQKHPSYWGATQIFQTNGTHFYRLD